MKTLDKKRTAILFTANTPHLAHANLMLDSLRDPQKGNFQGDIWVISTGLSDRAKNFLDSQNIKYLVNVLNSLYQWDKWEKIAEAQPEYKNVKGMHSREERLRYAFEAYRNKRMSKLILLDWVEKFGDQYDFIALGDNDLYFQKDIHNLFQTAYENHPDQISYWQEENVISVGSWLWKKDFHYSRYYDISELDFGAHEINIGFILGKPQVLANVFQDVKKSFYNIHIDLLTKHSWHDQDLVRLNRAKHPGNYALLPEGDIIHLCNGGNQVMMEKYSTEFYHVKTEEKPYIIHFAGGAWKNYPSIKDTYLVDPDWVYFDNEVKANYDLIRKNTPVNMYDIPNSKYYTSENDQYKHESRRKWMEVAHNGKKNLMFIGWMETNTHRSTYDALRPFFHSNEYNLVVLNGSTYHLQGESFVSENFPLILSQLTRITKDNALIAGFGYEMPNIPAWIVEDGIQAAMAEYQCTRRVAQAVINLVYLYFAEALDFYHPDLITLWGIYSPWGKTIRNICKWKNITICSLEWGVLPGTVSFDFCGHMADSWVAKEFEYFNNLALTAHDINNAKSYLEIADCSEFSRNKSEQISTETLECIQELKKQGKKLILYMESNSGHSGNTFADPSQAQYHSPFFHTDVDAYEAVLECCKEHDNWHILYKPHPIALSRGIQSKIDTKYTTVLYSGGLSEAIAESDLTVTILSQSAYVSLIKGVPTVLLGRTQLNGSGGAYVLQAKEQLGLLMQNALNMGITTEQKNNFVEHVARVMKYYAYTTTEKIQMQDVFALEKNLLGIIDGQYPEQYQFDRKAYLLQIQGKEMITADHNVVVSVIMPVYNASAYLAETICSVCSQSLKDIELICVNNGSTDHSQEILEYFAAIDSRIQIHYQEEPNQRTARNWGIKHATGKYIYLIDSDDTIDYNTLETLVNNAEAVNADLLYFFFREFRANLGAVRTRPRYYSYSRFFPKDKELFPLDASLYRYFIQYPFPWAKLMRRDFVLDNELYFDNDCSNFDDNPHNLRTLLSARNPYVLNKSFYNFRIHEKSMTQSKNPRIMGMIDAVRIMNKIYTEHNVYGMFQKWYVPYKVHLIGWAWDLLPDELKRDYYTHVSSLFSESDKHYFDCNDVWSYYEMPMPTYISRVKNMLTLDYNTFKDETFADHSDMDFDANNSETGKYIGAKRVLKKLGLLPFARKLYHKIFGYSWH